MYGFWEWKKSDGDNVPEKCNNWKYNDPTPIQGTNCEQSDAALKTRESELKNSRLDWSNDRDRETLNIAMRNGMCPAIVAMEGGHVGVTRDTPTMAVAVVPCECDLSKVGADESWLHSQARPLLMRVSILPDKIGALRTDNDTTEMLAVLDGSDILYGQ